MKRVVLKKMNDTTTRKYYKNRSADERQSELYKMFSQDTFLGDAKNVDHFMQWVTFFRRNLHRFATDYLGLKLYWYQSIILYLMGVSNFIVIIASRASSKSFIVAIYAVCVCILYPNSLGVVSSGTKKQAKLLVSEKIQKELMNYPALRKEISKVKDNQNDVVVFFRCHSTITVVAPNENSRGYRSTFIIRDEFRQLKKHIDGSVLAPFQIVRQIPYMTNDYYANKKELIEENVDIYISSSWFDNGSSWIWEIADQAYEDMINGKLSCMLAFDESIALKHSIKTLSYFQNEKKKQDPSTWALEFLNSRIKESQSAFFSYRSLEQNQICKQPFYPRMTLDFKSNRKNPYGIAKQKGEIRIVSCDMAFIENEKANDNSIFTCMRLLPESTSYHHEDSEIVADVGYRRVVPYIESMQGGEIKKQATRIRELFDDFVADYIVLDTRNAGISVYDVLARTLYDEDRNIEYPALTCMNNDSFAERIKVEGAEPRIFAINATPKLNSDIALEFRRILSEKKIDFLINFNDACEQILPNINEYVSAQYADTQIFYERPFLETQALFSETTSLVYEKKSDTGLIIVKEQGTSRKDRYTSCSYGSYFAGLLERDLLSGNDDYEFEVFIN